MIEIPIDKTEKYLSTSEVARRLSLSSERVRQLARSGALPPAKMTRLGRLWSPEAVESFAAQRELTAEAVESFAAQRELTAAGGTESGISGRHRNAADLILYADHLEDRVRRLEEVIVWLSRTFEYEDPETGEKVRNAPVWSDVDFYGNYLPKAVELRQTWEEVFSPDTVSES